MRRDPDVPGAVAEVVPTEEIAAQLAADKAVLEERVSQLERALESRVLIEQAKGILAERLTLEIDEAFELLRGAARANRLRIHDLSRQVVADRRTPIEIVERLG